MEMVHYREKEDLVKADSRNEESDRESTSVMNELSEHTRTLTSVREEKQKTVEEQAGLNLVLTIEYPRRCSCRILEGIVGESCWRYLGTENKCEKQECQPKWVCVNGMQTGETCTRRRVRSKIFANNDGTCRTMQIEEDYIYVPYKELVL